MLTPTIWFAYSSSVSREHCMQKMHTTLPFLENTICKYFF